MAESPLTQCSSSQINNPRRALLIAVVMMLCLGFLTSCRETKVEKNNPAANPASKKLTREESHRLLQLRDQANAHLENLRLKEADELLLQIIRSLPDDSFGRRNLTICRVLAAENAPDPDVRQAAITSAREALDQLMRLEPDSYVSHVLASRLAIREDDVERAQKALRRAAELAPNTAPVFYDLYSLVPLTPGEPPSAEAINSLRKVHELLPDNLYVLKDWLQMQVQIKAPDLLDTVVQIRAALKPFVEVIKQHLGHDVDKIANDLANAVVANDWQIIGRLAMPLRNIMAPEALRDERYVKLNSLEYMSHDYGTTFYERADLSSLPSDPAIPVKLVTAPKEQQPSLPQAAKDIAVLDLNLDGQMDAVALYADRVVVSAPFLTKSEEQSGNLITVAVTGDASGLVAADLDDDKDAGLDRDSSRKGHLADPDLILFGPGGIKFFENRKQKETGTRELIERPTSAEIATLQDVISVTPGDLDLDGDLDFVTLSADGIRLWSNRSNWTFEEITSRSKLPPAEFSATSAVVVDIDRDTDLDIVIAGAKGSGVLENIHHGRFRWRELDGEFRSLNGSTSLIVEELDGNGSWDLIGAGPQGLNVVLTRITPAGLVSAMKAMNIASSPFSKVASFDLDNDGLRDLLAHGDNGLSAWRGAGQGTFEAFELGLPGHEQTLAVAIADIDHDGDEDLIRATPADCEWVSNEGGNANGWINMSLVAMQLRPGEQNFSKRVNHAGIGSSIEVRAGSRYQAQVVKGPITHFGLGPNRKSDLARVLWTNGIPGNLINPERNADILEEQKLMGSCPYLYTWDGEKFVFFTDLLWNAPLGLKFAENVIAPWREWEYLKIDSDKLQAKDGEYTLRVTAELWEIEYFDQIRLFAVDHPAGVQIFTNEKVGPPSMAEHMFHTVHAPRFLVAARDSQGNDVLDQVKHRDGIYTKTYDHKLAQGLTTEHFLELDLGDWTTDSTSRTDNSAPAVKETADESVNQSSPPPRKVVLFLTGWMYPASTSLNVQFSQNPDGPKPQPPSLHAVDAKGQWHEVRPFMGFPGGKTKTIAVDISDVFEPGSTDHRVRIVTNMEFYWDAAFFKIDDEPGQFRETELKLVRARLQDRGGVSLRQWPQSGNGPELFDYQTLVPGDMWAPIEGAFTRYGNVLPLLTTRDDHLVVMHPGDEIQLAFASPADPLPEGWVRDFVINNVGWDKDCDLNTVYGETVEPMPFRAMTTYGQPRPMDEDYARYLKEYQTRTRSRAPFWNRLRQSQHP